MRRGGRRPPLALALGFSGSAAGWCVAVSRGMGSGLVEARTGGADLRDNRHGYRECNGERLDEGAHFPRRNKADIAVVVHSCRPVNNSLRLASEPKDFLLSV